MTGEPSAFPPLRNVTVPVGIPAPEAGVTVAVKVTDCPAVEGFGEELSAIFTGVPVDGTGEPVNGIENGLPGVPVETKTVPLVVAFATRKTSLVGANETLIVQFVPGLKLEGHPFVAEKFSEVRRPRIGSAVSPILVTVTDCGALTDPTA